MVSPQLATWQSKNNYRSDDDVVYGVYQGCGFSVSEDDDGLLFTFMLRPRDDEAFDDIEDALAQRGGELSEGQVGDVEGYLAVFFDQSHGLISGRTMNDILDFVVEQARPCGFRVPNTCVKCGARASKRSFLDGMVQPLCAECSAQNRQNRRAAAASAAQKKQPDRDSDEDERYAKQYTPIVPDSSKYDDSYDEYAGMSSSGRSYNRLQYDEDRESQNKNTGSQQFEPAPISFSDEAEVNYRSAAKDDPADDYREIMDGQSEHSATVSETYIEGSAGMGILGALLGSLAGVIPYIIIALAANFHMAALCFPAGMAAVWFYTIFKGRKSMTLGMSVSISAGVVISVITMFLCMVVSYMDQSRNFGQAVSYLFSEQGTFFAFNTVFATLGSAFGALFMIVLMSKYINED